MAPPQARELQDYLSGCVTCYFLRLSEASAWPQATEENIDGSQRIAWSPETPVSRSCTGYRSVLSRYQWFPPGFYSWAFVIVIAIPWREISGAGCYHASVGTDSVPRSFSRNVGLYNSYGSIWQSSMYPFGQTQDISGTTFPTRIHWKATLTWLWVVHSNSRQKFEICIHQTLNGTIFYKCTWTTISLIFASIPEDKFVRLLMIKIYRWMHNRTRLWSCGLYSFKPDPRKAKTSNAHCVTELITFPKVHWVPALSGMFDFH